MRDESRMAVSSFSMVFTVSAAVLDSCALDAVIIESKEAGFTVLGPWATFPPELGLCISTAGFFNGGTVLPPQYKREINIIATANVI